MTIDIDSLKKLPEEERIEAINKIKIQLHEISPLKNEPVDCVVWVKNEVVQANDYNPNTVAPPEMRLLEQSIMENGYTQPIVSWDRSDGILEVVDGFHRNRVGKECQPVKDRILGYLPVVVINNDKSDRSDRIAATIRHNRARGKHQIQSMSEIVLELKNRNWTNERISKQLGLDEDEILRLCQITGLENLFKDSDFTQSWNVEDSASENFEGFSEELDEGEKEANEFRSVNTSDPNRIFHTFDKWECFKSGFYNTCVDGKTESQCKEIYREFLSNLPEFEKSLDYIVHNWKYSCEHYLTNTGMNRIAYLGQAALAQARGIPQKYAGGFFLLTDKQQQEADQMALKYLNIWMKENGRPKITMAEARMDGKVVNIY